MPPICKARLITVKIKFIVKLINKILSELFIYSIVKNKIENPRITLKGLEYLSENLIMLRMYKITKGIKDLID